LPDRDREFAPRLHIPLGKIYANKAAAEESLNKSKRLVKQWNDRALPGVQQMGTDTSRN